MASLSVYTVLVVLFLTYGAVMATKENDQIIKENNCETKMGLPCVIEGFMSIFETGSISNKCRGEIVVLGKVFHLALVKRTLENPLFKDLSPAKIIAKSIQTWNNCLALIDSPSPST
ncbi:hypothetical protein ES319_D05G353200v1 [Gossypium barbadense]|uniref:Prolamin-like domain-containing protein n=3 Tax=Gossypium TaxID=3633 RepID=A0A5J5RU49_GOSBA|nr:hypothetical protein ES319_D05G353200v1 [Gossypium barbadense]TYG71193.1 hypothetical protein ES288_D05G374800v1 [Gossypium darwinii]TYH74094.1 hypothetical protein ES332_D05G373800v1 [Gossypium tomentosum]